MVPSPSQPRPLPEPTLRRLPRYLHLARSVQDTRPVVSSAWLGERLALDAIQVRKDLQAAGLVGRPKIGYQVAELVGTLETLLGWRNVRQAFLVGAGNLGAALIGYPRFRDAGLDILAAFDSDPAKVGGELHGKPIFPLGKLANLAQRMHVMVGVLAVPASAAQETADLLVRAGIRAIWNFAPVPLEVPEDVIVQNEDLYSGLAALTQKLSARLKEPSKKGK
ncbi:MAG TPA: redox-sensing transcriptional repressor Rex [Myxococcales bacterium]|jgi:redox-sensing transcriptional repressor